METRYTRGVSHPGETGMRVLPGVDGGFALPKSVLGVSTLSHGATVKFGSVPAWMRFQNRVFAMSSDDETAEALPWRAVLEPEWRAVLAATASLARSDSEDVLLNEVCEAAVRAGGYRLAWYGRILTNGHLELVAVSSAGPEQSYLEEEFSVSWGHGVTTNSPGGMAVDFGGPVFSHDILTDERFAP